MLFGLGALLPADLSTTVRYDSVSLCQERVNINLLHSEAEYRTTKRIKFAAIDRLKPTEDEEAVGSIF
jgi:hypothetical protein